MHVAPAPLPEFARSLVAEEADTYASARGLSRAERQIVHLAAVEGLDSHGELAKRRDVRPSTIKKQIQHLLAKTDAACLPDVSRAILCAALCRATDGR
jgi:DNA-binding CsgD family transcriptional regulator